MHLREAHTVSRARIWRDAYNKTAKGAKGTTQETKNTTDGNVDIKQSKGYNYTNDATTEAEKELQSKFTGEINFDYTEIYLRPQEIAEIVSAIKTGQAKMANDIVGSVYIANYYYTFALNEDGSIKITNELHVEQDEELVAMLDRRLENVKNGKGINGNVDFWSDSLRIQEALGFRSYEDFSRASRGNLGVTEVYGKQQKSDRTRNNRKSGGNPHKQKQYEILKGIKFSEDGYLGEIRSARDSLTFKEALDYDEWERYKADWYIATNALRSGEITVYSHKPIENGAFVTPFSDDARALAEDRKVIYSKKVKLEDVAWANSSEGRYAKITEADFDESAFSMPKKSVSGTEDILYESEAEKAQ